MELVNNITEEDHLALASHRASLLFLNNKNFIEILAKDLRVIQRPFQNPKQFPSFLLVLFGWITIHPAKSPRFIIINNYNINIWP